jgi:MFS family permease
VFAVFFYRDEMGLSLDQIGKAGAWGSMLFLIFVYPFGVLLDRWGCHKTYILGASMVTLSSLLMFFFAVDKTSAIGWMVIRVLALGLTALATNKWTVEVYPRDRYGQFGSAGALFASLGGIALGPVCGWWMESTTHYRCFLIWNAFFSALGMAAAVIVYRKWKTLGGPDAYRAP